MKLVPYSPYNRSYQFICVQNQLAHAKNKSKAVSTVDSNISFSSSAFTSMRSSRFSLDGESALLKSPPKKIHKNKGYDDKVKKQVKTQNERILSKLSKTTCRVITRNQSLSNYNKAEIYKSICRKFTNQNQRKEPVWVSGSSQIFDQMENSSDNLNSIRVRPLSSRNYRR